MYLIDKKGEIEPRDVGSYIGLLVNQQPVVVTCKSWIEGINEYKDLKLGNVNDRKEGHNSKTSIIFIYKSEEDEKKDILSKVSIYDKLWYHDMLYKYPRPNDFKFSKLPQINRFIEIIDDEIRKNNYNDLNQTKRKYIMILFL